MSLKLRPFGVLLIAGMPLVGCSQSSAPQTQSTTTAEFVELDDEDLQEVLYVECEDHEAETTPVIHVTIPKVMEDHPFRIPLCRRKIRELECFNSGSCFYADGVSADGFGIGHGGRIGIDGATDSSVEVSLSLCWTASDRTRGSFDELLRITVGKPSGKERDGNIKIGWTFEVPITSNDDGNPDAIY